MLNYFINYIFINIEISQNLFLFLILYLFYNVNLLKTFINEILNFVTTNYINNINVTIINVNSKKNNRKLTIFNKRTIN